MPTEGTPQERMERALKIAKSSLRRYRGKLPKRYFDDEPFENANAYLSMAWQIASDNRLELPPEYGKLKQFVDRLGRRYERLSEKELNKPEKPFHSSDSDIHPNYEAEDWSWIA